MCHHVSPHAGNWTSDTAEDFFEDSDSEAEGADGAEKGSEKGAKPIHLPGPDPVLKAYDEDALPSQVKDAHTLMSLENVQELKEELDAMQEAEKQAPVPEEDGPQKDPHSPFNVKEKPENGNETFYVPHTVTHILKAAGFSKFDAKEDTEEACLKRIRAMCPLIRDFIRRVRLDEGILSRAQICGKESVVGRHQQLEHLLARLRQKYELQGTRQSRWTAWAHFTKVAAEKAQEKGGAADQLSSFTPSCVSDQDGRKYQIIAVRLCLLSAPKFALVEELFRASTSRKGRKCGRKLSEVPLPSSMAASVRGILLEPVSMDKNGNWEMKATCRSPAAVFQVYDEDGVILWNAPRDQFEVTETAISLKIFIKKAAVEACSASTIGGTIPNFKAPSDEPKTAVSYTIEAFRNKKIVMQYVDVMKRMLFKNLGGRDVLG